MSDNILIIVIKYPEPGKVKTRLAKDIGNEKAASLYKGFVEKILKNTQHPDFYRIIFYTPSEKKQDIISWLGSDIDLCAQQGKGLGDRMYNAFKHIFEKGAKKAVIIGSDSPTINNNTILRAFNELEVKDCVIGPCQDGGYYLLGLNSLYKEIFQNVQWSTDQVFASTVDIFDKLRLNYVILEEKIDIDTKEDLR